MGTLNAIGVTEEALLPTVSALGDVGRQAGTTTRADRDITEDRQ